MVCARDARGEVRERVERDDGHHGTRLSRPTHFNVRRPPRPKGFASANHLSRPPPRRAMVFDGRSLLGSLDPSKITIATVTSHTSLQIFHGARKEGFRTLGICVGEPPRYFEGLPLGRPDEFLALKSWEELFERAEELRRRNVVLVPHGSF